MDVSRSSLEGLWANSHHCQCCPYTSIAVLFPLAKGHVFQRNQTTYSAIREAELDQLGESLGDDFFHAAQPVKRHRVDRLFGVFGTGC